MELQTTIMIVAPHEVQAIAVPILRRYAPETLIRVPAHLTVMYPFVPISQLDEASTKVHEICAGVSPFEITMRGYDSFPNVAFMNPTNPEPIQELFRRIFAAFPECPPYGGAFGNDLHPHMTVGEFANAEEQQAAVLPVYESVTFQVKQVHVLYGPINLALPWITHSVIPLGG
jgi:2'-5' RNA ligase